MSLFAPLLNYLWKSASDFGLDTAKLFEAADIDSNLRLDVSARVSAETFDKLVWLAKQQIDDDAFVFKVAEQLHPSYFGALGYAWMTSSTLRKAFARLSRYSALVNDEFHFLLEDQGDELHVIFETSEAVLRDPVLRELAQVAIQVQLCRMSYGDSFNPTRVQFRHAVPLNAHKYYEFFRCELKFNAEVTKLVIPVQVADQELPGFNPQLVHVFDEMIVEYLHQRQQDDIVGRTRTAIFMGLPSGDVSLESIAASLAMSSRTLARKLAENNISYKELLGFVRKEMAEKFIRDRSLTLTEISFLLGFAEMSSFSRAYKSWNGSSPSQHRKTLFMGRGAVPNSNQMTFQ